MGCASMVTNNDVYADVESSLTVIVRLLNEMKANDVSQRARYIAITVTMLEQALAFFSYWVTNAKS